MLGRGERKKERERERRREGNIRMKRRAMKEEKITLIHAHA